MSDKTIKALYRDHQSRLSPQPLLDNHMRLPIAVERAQPAPTAVDAHAATALCLRVGFDAGDERQPTCHGLAFASRNDAHHACLGQLQPGRRDGIDLVAAPDAPFSASHSSARPASTSRSISAKADRPVRRIARRKRGATIGQIVLTCSGSTQASSTEQGIEKRPRRRSAAGMCERERAVADRAHIDRTVAEFGRRRGRGCRQDRR